MPRSVASHALAAAALLIPALAPAQDAAALQRAALAANCSNCHGTQGRAIPGAAVPGLAGMPAGYLSEQMRLFKAGSRPATVMHQIARGFTDAQVAEIAAYFAAQPK